METIKTYAHIGITAVLIFMTEQSLGGNNENSIRLSCDSLIVTSQYVECEVGDSLGYYSFQVENSDSAKVIIGLYIKRESGLWLGIANTKSYNQDYFCGISALLTYLSKYEAIEKLEGMQTGIPYHIAVEVLKNVSSNKNWVKRKERIKKSISSSSYFTKLNECLKRYSLQITDISIDKIPKGASEVELFLKISKIELNPKDETSR